MNKRITTTIGLLAICSILIAYVSKALTDKLEDKYLLALDGWVQRGGKIQEYQSDVLETCGKLVMASATPSETLTLLTIQQEEFDFRVKVCAKTTVHRVRRQPELNDQELVREICEDINVPVFRRHCNRSDLR